MKHLIISAFSIAFVACTTTKNLNQSFLRGDSSPIIQTGEVVSEGSILAQVETHFEDDLNYVYNIRNRGANYRSFQSRHSLTFGYATPIGFSSNLIMWANFAFDAPDQASEISPDFGNKTPVSFGGSYYKRLSYIRNDLEFGLAGTGIFSVHHFYSRNNKAESGESIFAGSSFLIQPVLRRTFRNKMAAFVNPNLGYTIGPFKSIITGWNSGIEFPVLNRRISLGAGQSYTIQLGDLEMQESLRNLPIPLNVFISIR